MMKLPSKPRGRPPHADQLTPAEWRVVQAVRHGMSNKAIAAAMQVSLDAIKYHISNCLQKLALPNRVALRKWPGIAKHQALFNKEINMSEQHILGLGQVSRHVRDIAACTQWYRDVLGLTHLYSFAQMAFFDCGGVRLFLSQNELQPMPAESILYFKVADIRAAQQALSARGVQFINAPHMIHKHADGTEEWMVFFKDLEERPLALMSQVKRGVDA